MSNDDLEKPMHKPKSKNRLEKHLHLMGIERSPKFSEKDLQAEKELMESFELKPLDLSAPRASFFKTPSVSTFFALAAALVLGIYLWPKPDNQIPGGFTFKGKSSAKVYYELNGEVSPFTSGSQLPNGASVRVEIKATDDLHAFLSVIDGQGNLLTTKDVFTPLHLQKGETGVFPGSIALVGKNEGETLLIAFCPKTVNAPELASAWRDMGRSEPPLGCSMEKVKLR